MAAEKYPLYGADLLVMELTDHETPLTLMVLKKQYHRLSLRDHPDKNPPEESVKFTELYQNLGNSYQRLRQHVFDNTDVSQISGEEGKLYEFYVLHNIVRLNNGSVTVEIENCRTRQWGKVLSSVFGESYLNKDGTGQVWEVPDYKDSGRDVKVTLYPFPRKDNKSKILVQAGGEVSYLFSELELPTAYQQVLEYPSDELQGPVVFPCSQCEYKGESAKGLKIHTTKTKHSASPPTRSAVKPTSATRLSLKLPAVTVEHSQPVEEMKDLGEMTPPSSPSLLTSSPAPWSPAVVFERLKTVVNRGRWSKAPTPAISGPSPSSPGQPAQPPSTVLQPTAPSPSGPPETKQPSLNLLQSQPDADILSEDTTEVSAKFFPCPSCPRTFPDKTLLLQHTNAFHSGHITEEDEFNKVGSEQTLPDLSALLLQTTHDVFQCVQCQQGFNDEISLQSHVTITHTQPVFQCEICAQEFSDPVNLQSHIMAHNETDHGKQNPPKTLKCPKCSTVTVTEETMKSHMEIFHPFKCPECHDIFLDQGCLQRHLQEQHVTLFNTSAPVFIPSSQNQANVVIKFNCDQCEFIGEEAIQLINHTMTMHKLQDMLTCKFCGLFWSNSSTLQDHISATHASIPPNNIPSTSLELVASKILDMEKILETHTSLLSDMRSSLQKKEITPNSMLNENVVLTRRSLQPEPCDTLYVGDSIGHNVDFGEIERHMKSKVERVNAYSAVFDEQSKSPEFNLDDVVKNKLSEGKQFRNLVIQVGSVDITNIDTNTNPDLITNLEAFKQTAKTSAENIFKVGEKAIQNHPTLEKVVIMDRTPRCDKRDADPSSIKAQLSKFGNGQYDKLWAESNFKDKIVVGKHQLDCSGETRDRRFGPPTERYFDGIHLRGTSGKEDYTESVLNILHGASLCSKPTYRKPVQHASNNRRQSSNYVKKSPPVWINQQNNPSIRNTRPRQENYNQSQHYCNQSQHNYNQSQQSHSQQPQQNYNQSQRYYNQSQNYNQSQQSHNQQPQNYNQPQQYYNQSQQNNNDQLSQQTQSNNRQVLLPTPIPRCATGGNTELLNEKYNRYQPLPVSNRFSPLQN